MTAPRSLRFALAALLFAPLALAACDTDDPAPTLTITQTAQATADLSVLVQALQASDANQGTDYVSTLNSSGSFTVFAPTNQAFADLASVLGVSTSELLANPALDEILAYHVVAGAALKAADLSNGQEVQPLFSGDDFTVRTTSGVGIDTDGDGTVEANVIIDLADIEASNGVVHVIDTVLLPPSLF